MKIALLCIIFMCQQQLLQLVVLKLKKNDELKPILVSEDRSGQLLQQKIRNTITDMDDHLFCGRDHYDKYIIYFW